MNSKINDSSIEMDKHIIGDVNQTKQDLKLVQNNGHMQLLYEITKIIADSDSIGEGYSYTNYDIKFFKHEIKYAKNRKYPVDPSLAREYGIHGFGLYIIPALNIYKLFLKNCYTR
jgi:hypothetical protein